MGGTVQTHLHETWLTGLGWHWPFPASVQRFLRRNHHHRCVIVLIIFVFMIVIVIIILIMYFAAMCLQVSAVTPFADIVDVRMPEASHQDRKMVYVLRTASARIREMMGLSMGGIAEQGRPQRRQHL